MAASSGIQNYLNTLIFCVVAKTITVLVLGLLVFKAVRKYVIFLLTIEVGLVFIVIYSMIKIARYDKRMSVEAEKIRLSSINSISCPDYYVRGPSEKDPSVTVCKNEYATPDQRSVYKFQFETSTAGESNIDLNLIPIDDLFRKQTLEDACKLVSNSTIETASGIKSVYEQVPWTDLHPKCSII